MRHACYTLYIIVAIFILAGCEGKSEFRQTLESLDSVLVQNPDSVFNVLMTYEAEAQKQSQADRMYYELLRADAQNKALINFTTDSIMKEVVKYFDHHGNANEQMRAHYLLGCTYRDLQDVPMELQCFQEAVEKADSTDNDCDLYTLYAVYSQIASLYHTQNLQEEELIALEKCGGIVRKSSMFNHGYLKKIAKQKEDEALKTKKIFWIFIILSFITGTVLVVVVIRMKHAKERKIAEITKFYVDAIAEKEMMEGDIAKLQSKIANMESNVAEERRRMEEAMSQKKEDLAEVQRQIDFYTERIDVRDILQLLYAFKGTEIYSKFKSISASKDVTMKVTSGDWDLFMKKYHHYFPAFHSFIIAGNSLNIDEQRVCLLTAVEFSATEASKLLGLQKSQISNLRASSNKKLFDNEGSKTLNANLKSKFFA